MRIGGQIFRIVLPLFVFFIRCSFCFFASRTKCHENYVHFVGDARVRISNWRRTIPNIKCISIDFDRSHFFLWSFRLMQLTVTLDGRARNYHLKTLHFVRCGISLSFCFDGFFHSHFHCILLLNSFCYFSFVVRGKKLKKNCKFLCTRAYARCAYRNPLENVFLMFVQFRGIFFFRFVFRLISMSNIVQVEQHTRHTMDNWNDPEI